MFFHSGVGVSVSVSVAKRRGEREREREKKKATIPYEHKLTRPSQYHRLRLDKWQTGYLVCIS